MLVGASNPCPGGWRGDIHRECRCPDQRLQRYLSRLSGRGMDRVLRVTRTLADPAGRESLAAEGVAEALHFRPEGAGVPAATV